jgi:hypothetical protein
MVLGVLDDEDICLFCQGNRDSVNNFLYGVPEAYTAGANEASWDIGEGEIGSHW